MPFSPLHLLAFLFLLAFLLVFVQVGLATLAFEKLGLTPGQGMLLLFSSLVGSAINLPLFKVRSEPPPEGEFIPPPLRGWAFPQAPEGYTVIAVNVGGCLIPLAFSLHLMLDGRVPPLATLAATTLVAAVSYRFARPIPGLGIGMPLLLPPLAAALVALLLDSAHSAPLAYVGGTLGVLLGADVLHLKDVRRLGAPVASIGGAGTFDGIFLTGIVAVLLA